MPQGGVLMRFDKAGDRRLIQIMRELGKKSTQKHLRKGMRAGMKIIAAEARRMANVDEGVMKSSVKVRAGKRSRKGPRMIVQTTEKSYTAKGAPFYAHMVDTGHDYKIGPRQWKRNRLPPGKRTHRSPLPVIGHYPGTEWYRGAYDNKERVAASTAWALTANGVEPGVAKAMSWKSDLVTYMKGDATLFSLVGKRISFDRSRQTDPYPYLVIKRLGSDRMPCHGDHLLQKERRLVQSPMATFEVAIWTDDSVEVEDIYEAVNDALNGFKGQMGQTHVDHILELNALDPQVFQLAAKEYPPNHITVDYKMFYHEAIPVPT